MSKNNARWPEDEENFLRAYYMEYSDGEIARLLLLATGRKRDPVAIASTRRRLGLLQVARGETDE